ncbi:MAG: tryptophan-rich sensory protein [Eubacteriales bacterium]|nr:tryptophan-rich sensory protein [Eubacteriales bacterium]
MTRGKQIGLFFLIVGITLITGLLSGVAFPADDTLETLNKPAWAPPGSIFPWVWSALYLMMGIAAFLAARKRLPGTKKALTLYFLQLTVNALWSLFFFTLEWRLFSFFWLCLLIALVVLTIYEFKPLSPAAAWLMVPYLLWLCFAGALNLSLYLLNRPAG